MSYVGQKPVVVSKLFASDAQNTILKKCGIVGHPLEVNLVEVPKLLLNKIPEIDNLGKVIITMPTHIDVFTDNDMTNRLSDFAVVKDKKVLRLNWLEYKELLDKKDKLYFVSSKKGKECVTIDLWWPYSVLKDIIVENPVNNHVGEKIIIDTKYDKIILEPINNQTIPNTYEVYNPSCVIKNEDASFKIEVNGNQFTPDMVTWRSDKNYIKFIDQSGNLSSEGKGLIVKVKGETIGEDKLIVDIQGYDGIDPEISFNVVEKAVVKVYTYIVKSENNDSAFTDGEVNDAFIAANQILKQIGVQIIRFPLLLDPSKNPNRDVYYELIDGIGQSGHTYKTELTDMSKKPDGLEVYFIRGHVLSVESHFNSA